jgi:citrate lyase subunit beta/citryl-CoA lyase
MAVDLAGRHREKETVTVNYHLPEAGPKRIRPIRMPAIAPRYRERMPVMTIKPLRSALYMPASNPRALEKAKTLDVDAVIFDLEDAIAPDLKTQARDKACEAVRAGGYGNRQVAIRINGFATPWGEDDLDAAVAAGPDAILVPKITRSEDIEILSQTIAAGGSGDTRLWVMIETPMAILNIASIAAASQTPGSLLSCFMMGTNDLEKETRARLRPGRAAMHAWLSQCVCAARAYGLSILDGVYNDFADDDGFHAECDQGLELGMDGKTLIHPRQIDICNQVFSPTDEEVAWARRIVGEFDRPENISVNVMAIEGKMVERLHADLARQTIAIAEAIGR